MGTNSLRIEIYLTEEGSLCFTKSASHGEEGRFLTSVPLSELESLGQTVAANKIGETVLNLLKFWHNKMLGEWIAIPTPEDTSEDDYGCALRLINLALASKTAAYNPAIEQILMQASTENGEIREYFENVWPPLRNWLDLNEQ